jgi:hypothetical protein
MEIAGPAKTAGTLDLQLVDFDGQVLKKETRTFTLDANGITALPLAWMEKLPIGLYRVETQIRLADGFTDRDFHRLTVMPYLHNTH